MELEFDKEIDALLRKARSRSPAAAGALASVHLDADEFAAFAENALPDRAKQRFIVHLADCDSCRETLSGFISTVPEAAAKAASPAAPVKAIKAPWYRTLFAMPNLAYTMGGMVILFSGFVGLLVYQNRPSGNVELSRVANKAPAAAQPKVEGKEEEESSSPAAAANTAANSSSSSDSVTRSGVSVGTAGNPEPAAEEKQLQPAAGQDETTAGKVPAPVTTDSSAAPQPAPPPKDAPELKSTDRDAKLDTERREKDKEANVGAGALSDDAVKKSEDKRSLREAPASLAKSAPRSDGPRQVQNNTQSNEVQAQNQAGIPINGRNIGGVGLVAATRSIGGKTFSFRNGVWYDSAYAGGGTKDYRRGTDKYLKLDDGLRSIADSISGTVVIVWNSKSYKIR